MSTAELLPGIFCYNETECKLTLQCTLCETAGCTFPVPTLMNTGNDSDQNLQSRSFTMTRNITTCVLPRRANSTTAEKHLSSTKLLNFLSTIKCGFRSTVNCTCPVKKAILFQIETVYMRRQFKLHAQPAPAFWIIDKFTLAAYRLTREDMRSAFSCKPHPIRDVPSSTSFLATEKVVNLNF